MIIGDIETTEKVEYEDLLKNYYEKMEIIEEQDKEIERLKEELNELNGIIEIGRKREYHSKFLKDFQKERGKNVFPDHDEIYKRYDDYKDRVEKAIKYIEENDNKEPWKSLNGKELLEILEGRDKE